LLLDFLLELDFLLDELLMLELFLLLEILLELDFLFDELLILELFLLLLDFLLDDELLTTDELTLLSITLLLEGKLVVTFPSVTVTLYFVELILYPVGATTSESVYVPSGISEKVTFPELSEIFN